MIRAFSAVDVCRRTEARSQSAQPEASGRVGKSPPPDAFAPVDPARFHPRVQQMVEVFRSELERAQQEKIRPGALTLVIPARNEEKSIAQTLSHAVEGLPRGGDVLVVLNAVQDGTEQAVRDWARGRQDITFFDAQGLVRPPEPRPGTSAVTLLVKEEGGKLRALNSAYALLRSQGSVPEFVMQMDADTRFAPGSLEQLVNDARQGYSVVGGNAQLVPPAGSKKPVLMASQAMNLIQGSAQGQYLSGCAVLSRTPVFAAGHAAMFRVIPDAAAEDGLYSLLLHAAGEPIAVDRGVRFVSPAEMDRKTSRKQTERWVRGLVQLNELVEDPKAFREMKLGAMSMRPKDAARSAAAFSSLYFRQASSPAEAARLGAHLVRNLPEVVRAQAAAKKMGPTLDANEVYEWNPQR